MLWFLLFVGTITTVEIFVRLPIINTSARLLEAVGKSINTMAKKNVSDHWKQIVLLAYAKRLFLASISLFALIAIAISPLMVIGIVCAAIQLAFFEFIVTPTSILVSGVLALLYFRLRKWFLRAALQ